MIFDGKSVVLHLNHMNLRIETQPVAGRRGIAPKRNFTHIFKNVLNLFLCIKFNFFLSLSDLFPWWI